MRREEARCVWRMWSFFVLACVLGILGNKEKVCATQFPREVVVVKNEKTMVKQLVKGMQSHKEYFAFYYPGIEKDFRNYYKQSSDYSLFMEKIAKCNGYVWGTISGQCIMLAGKEKPYVIFQFGYLTSKKQEKKISKKVKKIAQKLKAKERVTKIRCVHDYLIEQMEYDTQYYNPYYAFFGGKGMCMSYALAFQRLMQEMHIPCRYVKGNNHAWNLVKVDGEWYNIDVTWDDNTSNRYRYFLKSDRDFSGHERLHTHMYKGLKIAKKSY